MADFSITGEVRLNSDPAEKSTSKWTVAAGNMIADFAKKAASELGKVVQSGVDYNASMESYLTNFKVMLGNEELAAAKLSELRKMAASTPFALSDLTEGTQTLLQFGIAADDTTGVLKQLGDISLGNADKLQTLVRAYGKMSSAQKVTLENVNMMIDAGFNPLNQICDATGESMSDLYKRISDGRVSFEELQYAVQAATSEGGQFYNGMLEASQTFSGRMSTLKDNVAALTGELTSGLFAALGDLVVKLNDVITSFLDSDEKMDQLKDTIGIAASVVAAAGAAFAGYKATIAATTVVTTAQKLAVTALNTANLQAAAGAGVFKVAMAALNSVVAANPIGLAVAAFAALTAGLITAYKSSETFRSGWNICMNWLHSATDFAVNSVLTTLNMLMSSIRGIAAALAALPQGAAAAVDAYNSAYAASRQNYTQKRNQKNWNNSHKDLEWDDDNGWVPKGTSSSGNGSSRAGSQTAANPYPAIASGAKKASKATKEAAAEVVKSISDTTTEIDGKITRTTENVTETLSNGKAQQKQVITETSRQMVDGVLKDIKTITEVGEKGKKTVKQTMETVREVAKTITATTSGIVDGIQTSTKTVTETLTDGTETQKRVITQTYDDVVDGALVTVERVKTIAADGTEEVAETIKEASIKSFDDLWKELQTHADTGLLGTFDNLYTAVKNKDWKSIGLWAANAIYGGLTADQKKQVNSFALGLVDKLNEALGNAQTALVQKGIDIGAQICKGLTSGFGEVWTQAKNLGTQLTGIFQGLKAPLSSAALAISQGLSGGLLSSFPAIYAGVGSMVGTIGAAFEGMMTAIASALNATVFGIPMGVIVAGAAVALGVAIAAICASLGASRKSPPSTGGGSASGGSGSGGISGDIDISTGTGSLEDAINANTKALEKTNAALADMIRQAGTLVLSDNMRLGSTVAASGTARVAAAANSYHREGDTNITQNFYNGHDTAAAQQREARWEADKARRQRR
ncbi:MAG: tape measure protein [Oscillospiraceae bacterium]|nr:MAG: tape measure protein [Oscillospiraceae bacterium]